MGSIPAILDIAFIFSNNFITEQPVNLSLSTFSKRSLSFLQPRKGKKVSRQFFSSPRKPVDASSVNPCILYPLKPVSGRGRTQLVGYRQKRRTVRKTPYTVLRPRLKIAWALGSRPYANLPNLPTRASKKRSSTFFRFKSDQSLDSIQSSGRVSNTLASICFSDQFTTQFSPKIWDATLLSSVRLSAAAPVVPNLPNFLSGEPAYSHTIQILPIVLNGFISGSMSRCNRPDATVATLRPGQFFRLNLFLTSNSLGAGAVPLKPFATHPQTLHSTKSWGLSLWYSAWKSRKLVLHRFNMGLKARYNSFYAFVSYPIKASLRKSSEPTKAIPELPFALRGSFTRNLTPARSLSPTDISSQFAFQALRPNAASLSYSPNLSILAPSASPVGVSPRSSRKPLQLRRPARLVQALQPSTPALFKRGATPTFRPYLGFRKVASSKSWELRKRLRRLRYLSRKAGRKARKKLRMWKRLVRKLPRSARLAISRSASRAKTWRRLRKPDILSLNLSKKKSRLHASASKPEKRPVLSQDNLMSSPFFARTLTRVFSDNLNRAEVSTLRTNLFERPHKTPALVVPFAAHHKLSQSSSASAVWFTESSEFWGNPKLMKYFFVWFSGAKGDTGPNTSPMYTFASSPRFVNWVLRFQNSTAPLYFGVQAPLLQRSNLWTASTSNVTIRKTLFRRLQNRAFRPTLATWYYKTLISFMESVSGRQVALNFGPFVEDALTFEDRALCILWSRRIIGFQRMLGHKIFAQEALMLVAVSLRLKDPTFLANWIRGMLKRLSFWKYRLLFRYLKFILQHLFKFSFGHFQFRGLKLQLKGKISVAGNARTRTLVYRVGDTSHSKMSNRVAYDLSFVNTFTGVLGFKLWFFY